MRRMARGVNRRGGVLPAEAPPAVPGLRSLTQVGEQSLIGFVQGQQPIPLLTKVFDPVARISEPGFRNLGSAQQCMHVGLCTPHACLSLGPRIIPCTDWRVEPMQFGWVNDPRARYLVSRGG